MSDKGRSEAESACLLGDLLARRGDTTSARGAFQSAIAMRDPEWSPRAARSGAAGSGATRPERPTPRPGG